MAQQSSLQWTDNARSEYQGSRWMFWWQTQGNAQAVLTWLGSDLNDFSSHGGPHRPQHIGVRLLPGGLPDRPSPLTLVRGVHYLHCSWHPIRLKEHLPMHHHKSSGTFSSARCGEAANSLPDSFCPGLELALHPGQMSHGLCYSLLCSLWATMLPSSVRICVLLA